MSLFDSFPHTCEVYRMTYLRESGQMGNREIPSVVLGGNEDSPLRCWVQNASAREIQIWEKRDVRVTHRVSFTTREAILLGDEIRITGGPGFQGQLLSVRTRPTERTAGYGLAYTAMCEIEL